MHENQIIPRIKALCSSCGWSFYRLAKESGITYSTLCTMLHKTTAPSIPSLIKICHGFGITLAQFFDEGSALADLTTEQKLHLARWDQLDPKNQQHVESYMEFLLSKQ